MSATWFGYVDMCKILVHYKAQVCVQNRRKNTAMHFAAEKHHRCVTSPAFAAARRVFFFCFYIVARCPCAICKACGLLFLVGKMLRRAPVTTNKKLSRCVTWC